MKRVEPYAVGIVSASVCVAEDVSRDEITEHVNRLHPTGISSPWELADDPTFASGEPNPCPCDGDPSRLHYLLHC